MMRLYYSPGACSLSPHIVLREAGYDFELKKVSLGDKAIEGGGDYRQVNPKGYVPTLELDDGTRLTEGPAIVQYLADHRPDAGLAPANGTLERYRLQEWLNFISTEVHKGFSPLFNKQIADVVRTATVDRLTQRLAWVAGQLDGKGYVLGERFTVADAYMFAVLRWAKPNGLELSRWPTIADWFARVAARPAVKEALAAEKLDRAAQH